MHPLAIGFWGAFFGAVGLMLLGAAAAFAQAHRRVALSAALAAVVSALFVVTCLGWLPIADPVAEARLAAHIGIFTALVLWVMLMLDLGLLRERRARRRLLLLAAMGAIAAASVIWWLTPRQGVVYGTFVAFAAGLGALPLAVFSARRGDRIAWFGVLAIASMLLGLVGGIWIVLERNLVPWQAHASAALAGIAYVISVGVMLWQRYSFLIELREVRAQGPRYDPITRMQSNAATGQMLAQAFGRQHSRPVVLIAVSIGNLYALENLHGRAALNHALFIFASRLRRCVPGGIDVGRLFDDGFLLVSRNARDLEGFYRLGHLLAKRLSRPVNLATAGEGDPGLQEPVPWVPQVGVGVLATVAHANPAIVVGKVRDMSRTAWSFASRVAWNDQASGRITEVPDLDTA